MLHAGVISQYFITKSISKYDFTIVYLLWLLKLIQPEIIAREWQEHSRVFQETFEVEEDDEKAVELSKWIIFTQRFRHWPKKGRNRLNGIGLIRRSL